MWDKGKKILCNGGAFILLLLLTVAVLLRQVPPKDFLDALRCVQILPLIGAICAMLVFFLCETCNLRTCLRLCGVSCSLPSSMRYAVIGFFFSAITPSSSGGQPMQLHAMSRDGKNTGHGMLAMLLQLAAYQCAALIFGAAGWFFSANRITDSIVRIAFWIGFACNGLLLTFVLAAMYGKTIPSAAVHFVLKFVKLFSEARAEEWEEKAGATLLSYRNAAEKLAQRKHVFAALVLRSVLQLGALYSVTFFVYRAFGLCEENLASICFLQGVLFLCVCSLPLPGAVGASESCFYLLFRSVFPENCLAEGMLLSRFFNCYLAVAVIGLALFAQKAIKNAAA